MKEPMKNQRREGDKWMSIWWNSRKKEIKN